MTLLGVTTPGESEPWSDDILGVLLIPSNSSITSLSDYFISYTAHLFSGSYHSAEKLIVYSTTLADWAEKFFLDILENEVILN